MKTAEKKVSHTPGPWICDETGVNAFGVPVFQIDQHEDAPAPDGGNHAVCLADVYGDEANAKLIAAAPELLKALKELLPLAEDGYKRHNDSGSSHEEFLKEDRTALYEAREAIKKATE